MLAWSWLGWAVKQHSETTAFFQYRKPLTARVTVGLEATADELGGAEDIALSTDEGSSVRSLRKPGRVIRGGLSETPLCMVLSSSGLCCNVLARLRTDREGEFELDSSPNGIRPSIGVVTAGEAGGGGLGRVAKLRLVDLGEGDMCALEMLVPLLLLPLLLAVTKLALLLAPLPEDRVR